MHSSQSETRSQRRGPTKQKAQVRAAKDTERARRERRIKERTRGVAGVGTWGGGKQKKAEEREGGREGRRGRGRAGIEKEGGGMEAKEITKWEKNSQESTEMN